jgi:hypothetical protein
MLGLRFITAAVVMIVLLAVRGNLHAQSAANAPNNVHIKTAPEADVAEAKTALLTALTTEVLPVNWQNSPTTFGPTLWKTLAPLSDPAQLKGISTVTVFIDAKPPIQADGRGANTPAQHIILWKLLVKTYPALKTATVRPATAKEILYYWGTIPFDIDEPLFALDAGSDTFIVNLPRMKGKISLFWIDRVAPYEELRQKS